MPTYVDTFPLKQNDTSPQFKTTVKKPNGDAKDLTGYNKIRFLMRSPGSDTAKVDADTDSGVVVIDAATGEIKYEWSEADTDESGMWQAEWEITYGDGTTETYPNGERYIAVEIGDDVG